jgi:hypothetical protein
MAPFFIVLCLWWKYRLMNIILKFPDVNQIHIKPYYLINIPSLK